MYFAYLKRVKHALSLPTFRLFYYSEIVILGTFLSCSVLTLGLTRLYFYTRHKFSKAFNCICRYHLHMIPKERQECHTALYTVSSSREEISIPGVLCHCITIFNTSAPACTMWCLLYYQCNKDPTFKINVKF